MKGECPKRGGNAEMSVGRRGKRKGGMLIDM